MDGPFEDKPYGCEMVSGPGLIPGHVLVSQSATFEARQIIRHLKNSFQLWHAGPSEPIKTVQVMVICRKINTWSTTKRTHLG